MLSAGDKTLGQMFWARVEQSAGQPAQMVKKGDRWHTLTWAEVGERVRELALGLLALRLARGETVALLSRSRAEWVQADFAIVSAGGVTVPIYPTYTSEQIAYLVNDSEARTIFVEDPAQLVKVLEARASMPELERIVVIQGYEGRDPAVLTWDGLRRLGREHEAALRSLLADRLGAARPDEVATIVYTSGTTGPAKGVVQTHRNHMAALGATAEVAPVRTGDVHLLFLPLAHSFARLEAFMGVYYGLTTAFAESLDTLAENIREVRPHFIVGVPRVYEKVQARILAGVQASSPIRRRIFSRALEIGREVSRLTMAGRPISLALRMKRAVAHRLVFSKLHQALGGRLRFAVSGGAPLSPEIAAFFHATGLLVLEGYGLTESCPVLSFNRIDHFKFGSVGRPVPGVDLRIAPDGEILARGANVATRGYWKRPEATAETFDPDGWLRTGDIGRIDEDGFLFITDRKKDLIVTSGGINIAPQVIENLLRGDPLVSQAMVYGDRRPYPVALVSVEREALARLARARGLLSTDYAQLARHPEVLDRVQRIVEEKNAQLPSYARVKKVAVLPADLSEETGELTPTQKVKRKLVAEKYADLLESLYERPAAETGSPRR
jgi:long-chain acyl-CoA synthetase